MKQNGKFSLCLTSDRRNFMINKDSYLQRKLNSCQRNSRKSCLKIISITKPSAVY